MDLFAPEVRGQTFVSMWDHLRAGRFDVDPDAVDREAIVRDGRTYAYWGPFPALLRGMIEMFVDRDGRDWSRLSTLLATLVAAYVLLREIYRPFTEESDRPEQQSLCFVVALGWLFGSPLWITMSSGFLYHEAILWALAWSLVFLSTFLKVFREGWSPGRGVLLGSSAGLTILCRVPCGIGPGLALAGSVAATLANRDGRRTGGRATRCLVFALAAYAVFLACALIVNYGRWGNPLNFAPIESYAEHLADPARGRRFAASGTFNVRRLPVALEYYFVPQSGTFSPKFPFVVMSGWDPWKNGRGELFSYMDPYNIALPVSTPFVALMLVSGALAFARRPTTGEGLLLASFAVQTVALFTYMATAMRYHDDLLPLYFLLGSIAVREVARANRRMAACMTALVATVVVISIYCATITMLFYKSFIFAVPLETRERIFTWIHPS